MKGETTRLLMLTFLCTHIALAWAQDSGNYYDEEYYEDYVDDNDCGWREHFCASTQTCNNATEACDGQCVKDFYFCPSTSSCLQNSEPCDGQCGGDYRFCPSTDTCIDKSAACDGNCSDDYPNICDNGTYCYPNSYINDQDYDCLDGSDEYRPTGEPCIGFYHFCPSTDLCLNDSEDCDGQCVEDYHFCAYTDTCISKSKACNRTCPDDLPNLCDNGTVCYPNSYINDRYYDCIDRSDEYRPTGEPCGGFYRFCPSNESCLLDSEACDRQCGKDYHFCPSNSSCFHDSDPCEGQCGADYDFSLLTNTCIKCNHFERFCPYTGLCHRNSEPCDGQCGFPYHLCPSTGSCLRDSEVCDGQCGGNYHFSPSTDTCIKCKYFDHFCPFNGSCIPKSETCDGQCEYSYHLCPSNGLCLHDSEACDGQCGRDYHFIHFNDTCIKCKSQEHFCPSTGSCLQNSKDCEGKCGKSNHFCPSTGSCLPDAESCDGQCGGGYHFCPSTDSCIDKSIACDGICPDDRPNLCDGMLCYPKSWINNRLYQCADRSDEHRPIEDPPPVDISSQDKFLQLNTGKDEDGYPGLDCQDGTVHRYRWWCKEDYSRMCGGVSTTDYFICHNASIWRNHSCGEGHVRGCKIPGKCAYEGYNCDGLVKGSYFDDCGASDYSDEVCQVNEKNLRKHSRYFKCKDNSSLIHPTLICDGYKHCGDASDENECDVCPRTNNMVVHGQEVQLKTEEIRDLAHLKNTAIMKCDAMCTTPGDGIPECSWELKEGIWQTQDEVELTTTILWRTIFKYMSYILLISLVVLFKITQMGYLCQKPTVDVPILTSFHRIIPHDDEPLPLAIPMRSFTAAESSFPTPFFTTTEPKQLTQQFREYYIQNHRSEYFKYFFNFCLILSQFLPTRIERDIFHLEIYALEAQIHDMSPTCTDQCLKQHSSPALEPMFDAVYGSFSYKFPNEVNNLLYTKDKLLSLHYFLRIKSFLFRYFFFYYDIVQEYVLLSFILGTAGLGISTTFWTELSQFNYVHIMIYLYITSAFLPTILFAIQLAFSSQIGIIFEIKKPSGGQKILFGFCCFIFSPFIPAVLFFRMEKKQLKMFNCARKTSKALSKLNNENIENVEDLSLKQQIIAASNTLMDTNSEITEAKSVYKKFKEWELAIELPIQSSHTTIFSFMKKSTTVVNQVFQNWFISDTASLVLLIGMSLRSIIAVQISDMSARKNNFLGIKSKMFLAPLYMLTSIPRIACIVIYMAVPLGLMDLLGHWTVEKQGSRYAVFFGQDTINISRLKDCTRDSGYNITTENSFEFSSTVFSSDVNSTKYTVWNTPTYIVILMAMLATSVITNFAWLWLRSRKSLSEKILSSAKSVLCITVDSDFDEDDENVSPKQLQFHYIDKFSKVHQEYILKLLLHTGTNMALTFPWALAYQAANKRHQLLTTIGDCYGVEGTVEMENISLKRLWWGQWIFPLLIALLGILNYRWFRIYVKYGHPWRRLLISDSERIEEWRTLKLWEMLENQNDDRAREMNGDIFNKPGAVSTVFDGDTGRNGGMKVDDLLIEDGGSSNRKEEYQEKS